MAFRISPDLPLVDDLRRIAREQIDGAIAECPDGSLADDERVHGVRKRCKKLRGLLRLVRPSLGNTYRRENTHFRDAARVLAPLREAHSLVAAYDAVVAHFEGAADRETFSALRRRLVVRTKRRARNLTDLAERLADVRGRMEAARERVADLPLDATAGPEVWRAGFERTYRQARRALAAAYQEPTPERFHEWRKVVKYHWYHTRLLSPLWDQGLVSRAQAADSLGEILGLHHDLAVLRATLAGSRGGAASVDWFVGLIDRHQAHLEATARPLGMRLFAEKASRIGARHENYWAAWLEDLRGRRDDTIPRAAGLSA